MAMRRQGQVGIYNHTTSGAMQAELVHLCTKVKGHENKDGPSGGGARF